MQSNEKRLIISCAFLVKTIKPRGRTPGSEMVTADHSHRLVIIYLMKPARTHLACRTWALWRPWRCRPAPSPGPSCSCGCSSSSFSTRPTGESRRACWECWARRCPPRRCCWGPRWSRRTGGGIMKHTLKFLHWAWKDACSRHSHRLCQRWRTGLCLTSTWMLMG